MDSLISEMEKMLTSSKENSDIQNIIGESAGKNIDDLLIEADKLISETLPYFQTNSNKNKVKSVQDVEIIKNNSTIKKTHHTNQQNDTKRVVFNLNNDSKSIKISEKHSKTCENYGKFATDKCNIDEEGKKDNICSSSLNSYTSDLKISKMNFMKTQLQVSSSMFENHKILQTMCNRHDKLINKMETQDQISKLKLEEELNYFKLRNEELEKNLLSKEQEIQNWESRYQKLSQHCEKFSKSNIEETLKSYECQLNELMERNMTRETQLHAIIRNLLEEIDLSHFQYRMKLSEKNKQIRKYLDQIEKILDNVYELKNNKIKR